MGSHGAATAEGQADVLAHYGITEAAMGCPVVSQLEVVSLGKTADGIEAFMDRLAYESDGVMLVGRVKWHTDFAGKIESGLFKMMAIGLGKFAGAQRYHAYAYRLGLEHVIRSVGRQVLAVGQDSGRPGHSGRRQPQHRQAGCRAGGSDGAARGGEPGAGEDRGWRSIPMDLDILILDEIGKNISGAGMDTKVVNRGVNGEYNPWPGMPQLRAHLRARPERADLQQRRRAGHGRRGDRPAGEPHRLGAHLDQLADRQYARRPSARRSTFPPTANASSASRPRWANSTWREVTYGWIRNTMELGRLALSENLRAADRERTRCWKSKPPSISNSTEEET